MGQLSTPSPPRLTMMSRSRSGMVLSDVSFSIAETTLVDSVSFELSTQGMVGLVGQNGSGKSTLLQILARQKTATNGRVSLDNKPIAHWSERAFAQRVAYLPQHAPLASGLTGRELVELGRYPWHGALGRFSEQDKAQVDHALELTQTGDFADRSVDSLSGGERQRVWLAMLIAQDANLLLLDEPISALDPAHQTSVLSLIRQICDRTQIAALVVLHDVNLAARYCDKIIALKAGRLIACDSPESFMTTEQLTAVYDVDMSVVKVPGTNETIAFVSP